MRTKVIVELCSFVFPMWNEEAGAARALKAALLTGEDLVERGLIAGFEVIAVDDASTDGTLDVLAEAARGDPRIRVVHHEDNRMLGGSIKSGLGAARGEVVVYTDADLPVDLGEVERALRILHVHDVQVVAGYWLGGGAESASRSFLSLVYSVLVRRWLRLPVQDVNCAFKVLRRDSFQGIDLRSRSLFVDAELLARIHHRGGTVVQVGVDLFPRRTGTSSTTSRRVLKATMKDLITLGPELRRLRVEADRDVPADLEE